MGRRHRWQADLVARTVIRTSIGQEELKLIRDMRRRNPKLDTIEFWRRLRQRGYNRRPESL